jgi:glucokinase
VSPRGRHVFGIDVGGTNLRVAMGYETGEMVDKRHRDTHPMAGANEGIKTLAEMMEELARDHGLATTDFGSAGVGVPGPTDPVKGMLIDPPHLPGWHNVPVAGLLEAATGVPTHLENDAQLAAYGEFHKGAGRGSRHLVFVTISTGIGGGIVIDGKLYSGAGGAAGEVGHVVIDPNGPICSCGRRGHLEALASGTSMARIAAERIAAGSQTAADAGRLLGLSLGGLLNILDPEVLVLGGGVIQIGPLLLDHLYAAIQEQAFEFTYSHVRIATASLGQDAGLVGALEWARDHLPGGREGTSPHA